MCPQRICSCTDSRHISGSAGIEEVERGLGGGGGLKGNGWDQVGVRVNGGYRARQGWSLSEWWWRWVSK